jgi:hypothetical protein
MNNKLYLEPDLVHIKEQTSTHKTKECCETLGFGSWWLCAILWLLQQHNFIRGPFTESKLDLLVRTIGLSADGPPRHKAAGRRISKAGGGTGGAQKPEWLHTR